MKTMLDALRRPAAAAKACPEGLPATARAAAAAAAGGVEATKSMIATTGKARTLGARSLGHPDPGAVSMSLILEAMRTTSRHEARPARPRLPGPAHRSHAGSRARGIG